ncbi:O-antigen ligase family protein [Gloeocapsopsis dulcis]|uniref:O-antigen ligase-related domain-containing protein n=2 Tax=Gloeocapsopsis TaxID=693222 RepID=A0A6N8G487_9CHRO|nr:O-antigen ligase family protein [Gloeocapsopsis dulcis]MUL39185.1 hypothetical protein [Gloeocapsopsis dulcis AAB1 = 1H9]
MQPQNLEEKLIWYLLIGTYLLYFLGAQYIVVPAVAWFLSLYLLRKIWGQTPKEQLNNQNNIPATVWVWMVCMVCILFVIVIGHNDFNLGTTRTINSIINWARQHALFALFLLISCLNIRAQLIYRAVCIICLQGLIFTALGYLAFALQLTIPGSLYQGNVYVSPLKFAGGGSLLYEVSLYLTEHGQLRMSLFTPWAPALGLVANIYFFLAYHESNRIWKWIGMTGAVVMIVVSVSRSALICLPITLVLTWFFVHFSRPIVQITFGLVSFVTGIFATQLLNLLTTIQANFTSARPSSSRVRNTLGEIGMYRWWNEAPVWGHGIQDNPGPKLVEGMPIGSHHTWIGLLFTNGIMGFIALGIPFVWSFIDLLLKVHKSKTAQAGLSVIIVLFIFSFAENIEGLTYIYWPGLLTMGLAFKEAVYRKQNLVIA